MLSSYFAHDILNYEDLVSELELGSRVVELTENVIVAVIKLPPDKSLVLKVSKDLSREIMMMERLRCEYIAKVYASGELLDKQWILMEYCELGDLFQLLLVKGRFREEVVRTLAWQLIIAAGACHSANIAHLDIKLENCFMTKQGTIRLGDFGHAHPNFKNLVLVAGTKEYQAPEIVRRDPFDGFVADVFSIGVCLFIMLYGRRPWVRADEGDKYYRYFLKSRDDFWVHYADPEVSEAAVEVLDLMLEPVPEIRFSLNEIRKLAWFRGKILSPDEIAEYFA
mmetsp:Transcript_20803/g.38647  ORF Transcript_20803/g.38647 Transcript_20803/m.38647 type:complete len:281 (-) Transcript_20803:593-1435(-)